MLPLVKPVILAIGLCSASMGNWNNFRLPLIYLHQPIERFTLPLGLQFFQATLIGRRGAALALHDGDVHADGRSRS